MSRQELEQISTKIRIDDLDSFDSNKRKIINEYGLSNNGFSKALSLIKEHREFSLNIGREIKFGEIKDGSLENLAGLIKLKERKTDILEKNSIYIYPADNPYRDCHKVDRETLIGLDEDILRQGRLLLEEAEESEIKQLLSLFALGNSNDFSESLDEILKMWESDISHPQDDYILSKFNSSDTFVRALMKSGQISYLKIFEMHMAGEE